MTGVFLNRINNLLMPGFRAIVYGEEGNILPLNKLSHNVSHRPTLGSLSLDPTANLIN